PSVRRRGAARRPPVPAGRATGSVGGHVPTGGGGRRARSVSGGAAGLGRVPSGGAGRARCEAAARPEQERLDGSHGEAKVGRDLRIGEPLPFAQEDGAALTLGKVRKCVPERVDLLAPLV